MGGGSHGGDGGGRTASKSYVVPKTTVFRLLRILDCMSSFNQYKMAIHNAIQGHSRSPILVPIKSPYIGLLVSESYKHISYPALFSRHRELLTNGRRPDCETEPHSLCVKSVLGCRTILRSYCQYEIILSHWQTSNSSFKLARTVRLYVDQDPAGIRPRPNNTRPIQHNQSLLDRNLNIYLLTTANIIMTDE